MISYVLKMTFRLPASRWYNVSRGAAKTEGTEFTIALGVSSDFLLIYIANRNANARAASTPKRNAYCLDKEKALAPHSTQVFIVES